MLKARVSLVIGFVVLCALGVFSLWVWSSWQTHNQPKVPGKTEISLTIIEGWDIRDIAARLGIINSSWVSALESSAGSSTDATAFALAWRTKFPFLAALPLSRSLEGYLLPNTYRVWAEDMPVTLIEKQLATFNERVYQRWQAQTPPAPLKTFDEAMILASIVEREIHGYDHRRHVAGIFLGRLRDGMPLQSDATLSYLTNSNRARANANDLAKTSLYNTYQHVGLPPSPIGNPSEEAIQAVFAALITSDRYFLTDTHGQVLYAKTFAQHQQNRRRAGYSFAP